MLASMVGGVAACAHHSANLNGWLAAIRRLSGYGVKALTVVDEHNRESLGGLVDYSITALDLVDQLEFPSIQRGAPKALRINNGQESFLSPYPIG